MYIITWKNKMSCETGYVKQIKPSAKCFINTFEKNEARCFKTEKMAEKSIEQLTSFGEAENNDFSVIPA